MTAGCHSNRSHEGPFPVRWSSKIPLAHIAQAEVFLRQPVEPGISMSREGSGGRADEVIAVDTGAQYVKALKDGFQPHLGVDLFLSGGFTLADCVAQLQEAKAYPKSYLSDFRLDRVSLRNLPAELSPMVSDEQWEAAKGKTGWADPSAKVKKADREKLVINGGDGKVTFWIAGWGDFGTLILAGDVGLDVLLEVELAALPGNGTKDGFASGGHAGVIVADDVSDAAESALDEALEEGTPMDFGFTEGDADAEDDALANGGDAHGDEDGAVAKLAVVADFFVAGVKDQIGAGTQGTVAPFLEFCVEEFGAVADLDGTDGVAAEFFDDGGDFAGGNALDIHFCHGEFESLFGANAFVEGTGIEGSLTADLRDAEGDGADAAGESSS